MTPAISLEVLPAGYGDSLLIECPVKGRTWRLLVDTGPDECWPMLKDRLSRIPLNDQGRRHIDLVVISHIDHDHIGAAGLLFADRSLNLSFGDIWFNAPPRRTTRGVAEGHALSNLLGAGNVALPWNRAFGGRHAVTPDPGSFVELPQSAGAPRMTLLSPAPKQLSRLFKVWERELAKLRAKEVAKVEPARGLRRGAAALDPVALAARKTAVDRSPANGSSIAFLLEHGGASVLLAADAFSSVLVPALSALAKHRQWVGGIKVDAFKLSHHGSRGNVTNAVLKAAQADHYIFSTNGAIFNHPDDEAVARVIVNGGDKPRLWFNFDSDRTRRWCDPALQQRHGYSAVAPAEGDAGVALSLSGRPEREGGAGGDNCTVAPRPRRRGA